MKLEIDFDDAGAVGLMHDLYAQYADLRVPLKRSGQYIVGLSQQAFADEADPVTHAAWPELSAATKKRRRGTSEQILRDTSHLFASIHAGQPSADSIDVGTNVFYGIYHQLGTRNVPQRRFLGIDRAGEDEIVAIFDRLIEQALHG